MAIILKVIVCPMFVENHTGIRNVTAIPVDIVNISMISDSLLMHSALYVRDLHRCGISPCINLVKIFSSMSAHTIIHEISVGNILENTVGHEYTFIHLPYCYGCYSIKKIHALMLYWYIKCHRE